MDDRAGHIEEDVIRTAREPYQRVMLRAGHNEPFGALNSLVKAHNARWSVIGNNIAPQLRPEADDEVHSSCGGPRFTNCGNCGRKFVALLCVQNVNLQVRMRGRSQSEDASLRR